MKLRRVDLAGAENIQRLCAFVAHRYGVYLSPDDREDLFSHLLEVAVRLSHTYDPARDPSGSFRTYLGYLLPRRAHDWLRKRSGRTRWQFHDRTYERERRIVLSLDAPMGDGGRDCLGATLAASGGDPEESCDPEAFGGLLGGGSPSRDADLALLAETPPRRTRR